MNIHVSHVRNDEGPRQQPSQEQTYTKTIHIAIYTTLPKYQTIYNLKYKNKMKNTIGQIVTQLTKNPLNVSLTLLKQKQATHHNPCPTLIYDFQWSITPRLTQYCREAIRYEPNHC